MGWYDDGSEEQHQMEQARRAHAAEEARRARLIVFSIAARKAELLNALEDIARTQVSCDHEFNPWILGAWWDKSNVRVCGKCGFTEHRGANTSGAPHE